MRNGILFVFASGLFSALIVGTPSLNAAFASSMLTDVNSSGSRYECHNGLCRMHAVKPSEHAAIVSSEPLTADKSWQEVPGGHLVIVNESRSVQVLPM